MISRCYIEAHPGEDWRKVSDLFGEWLEKSTLLQSFGFSEGDAIAHRGIVLFCFKFPAHHGEKIELFPQWAKGTGRLFGGAEDGVIHLSDGESVSLPPEPVRSVPSWLK